MAGEPIELGTSRPDRSGDGTATPFVKSVAQRRLPEVIAEQIVEGIRRLGLKPGDRLPTEEQLSRQLMVGRTSVREGLQKLQTLGIVEVRKGLGSFVAEPSPTDPSEAFRRWSAERAFAIEELVEVRIAVEAQAASLASIRADERQLAEIARLQVEYSEADDDLDRMVQCDERFHDAIFQASGNHLLQILHRDVIAEVLEFRQKTLALPWAHARSVAGHSEIVRAIRSRDPAAARSAMTDHLWVLYVEVQEAAGPGTADFAPRDAFA